MTTAVLTSKGRITIPEDVRGRLNVAAGDRVEFVETGPGVFTIIAITRDIRELKGIVPKPGRPVSLDDMNVGIARHVRKKYLGGK